MSRHVWLGLAVGASTLATVSTAFGGHIYAWEFDVWVWTTSVWAFNWWIVRGRLDDHS